VTQSEKLKDQLGDRLLSILETEDDLSPSMVSAMVNYLKAFPPPNDLEELPVAQRISESLVDFKKIMPFNSKVSVS